MNFWWGRRSKGGHKGNLWNVNIFFFLATFRTAPLIAFVRIKLSEFSFSSLAPFLRAKQENRNYHVWLHRFFSCCRPLKMKMIGKQDIFLEHSQNEAPFVRFVLVVHGGGTPGTGSVWLCFSAEEEMRGLLFLSAYECKLLSSNFSCSHHTHKQMHTPASCCRRNVHPCDFNHGFHHRQCLSFLM